jgi:hypothetical protein
VAPPELPPRSAQPPSSQSPVETANAAAIRDVLEQLVAGLESMDVAAIRRVWPAASTDLSFRAVRTYTMEFADLRVDVQGTTAAVTGTRIVRAVMTDGRRQESTGPATILMRRGSSRWLIANIE